MVAGGILILLNPVRKMKYLSIIYTGNKNCHIQLPHKNCSCRRGFRRGQYKLSLVIKTKLVNKTRVFFVIPGNGIARINKQPDLLSHLREQMVQGLQAEVLISSHHQKLSPEHYKVPLYIVQTDRRKSVYNYILTTPVLGMKDPNL